MPKSANQCLPACLSDTVADFVVEQLSGLLTAVAAGAVLAVSYDIFRVIRRTVRHAVWVVSGEDLVFWIISAFVIFCFFLSVDSGNFRMYMIFGLLAGIALYRITAGRIFVRGMSFFLRKIKEIFRKLLKKAVNKPKIKRRMKNSKVRGDCIEK